MEYDNILTPEDLKKDKKNEARYLVKKRKAILESENRRRRNELRKIKQRNRKRNTKKDNIRAKRTTTKVLMYFILINCTVVEIYSMIAMYLLADLSALYSLIGAVIGESIAYAIYCCKSFHETKEERRQDFEKEKWLSEVSCNEEVNEEIEEEVE